MTDPRNANTSSFVVWHDSAPRVTNSNSSDVREKLGINWVQSELLEAACLNEGPSEHCQVEVDKISADAGLSTSA